MPFSAAYFFDFSNSRAWINLDSHACTTHYCHNKEQHKRDAIDNRAKSLDATTGREPVRHHSYHRNHQMILNQQWLTAINEKDSRDREGEEERQEQRQTDHSGSIKRYDYLIV